MSANEWGSELRAALQKVLQDHDCAVCPKCSRVLDERDVEWSGGATEAGTDFYSVEVDCSSCGHVLRSGGGWGGPWSDTDRPEYLDEALSAPA